LGATTFVEDDRLDRIWQLEGPRGRDKVRRFVVSESKLLEVTKSNCPLVLSALLGTPVSLQEELRKLIDRMSLRRPAPPISKSSIVLCPVTYNV
jgi:hypothetical protein